MATSLAGDYEEENSVSRENGHTVGGVHSGSSDDEDSERMTAAEVLEKLEEVSN